VLRPEDFWPWADDADGLMMDIALVCFNMCQCAGEQAPHAAEGEADFECGMAKSGGRWRGSARGELSSGESRTG
jgi:hypothetical protein